MALSQSDKIWLVLNDRLIEGAPEDLMIMGAFDHLFDPSPVQFNSENGTFSIRNENRGSIYVAGEGILKHWTEKAINRAGFSVSEIQTSPYIIVPDVSSSNWQLVSLSSKQTFNTIYELVSWLSKKHDSFI
jgi:iron complex transport system ATP-binding protein